MLQETRPLRLRPDLVITRAWFEQIAEDHWAAHVEYRKRGLAGKCALVSVLEPGYDPTWDGGLEAADQIREYMEKEV